MKLRHGDASVAILQDVPLALWDELVRDCPWGSFYHSRRNLEIIRSVSPAKVVFIVAGSGEEALLGGLALGVQEGCLGAVVNCLPYFGSYGDALISRQGTAEVERQLYQTALEYCQAIDALCLTVITSPFAETAHHREIQQWLEPTFVDERCCQIAHLPQYLDQGKEDYTETLLVQMEGRARTAYRKTLKSGLELRRVETEAEALEFACVHRTNIGSKGGVFKTEAFFNLAFNMSTELPKDVELAIVRRDNVITGGVVLFRFKDTVEYHTTCLREEYRSSGPLNRIIVEKMIDAGIAGFRYWNFGGTWKSQVGVYQFKKSFGAQDHPYFYFSKFLRDLERVRLLSPDVIVREYPLCYVIPFPHIDNKA